MSSLCKPHFFSKNIIVYAIFGDQIFKNMLANNIVSFEQMGPGHPGHLYEIVRQVANSDQILHSAASDLGLHCLLRPVQILRVNMVFESNQTPSGILNPIK